MVSITVKKANNSIRSSYFININGETFVTNEENGKKIIDYYNSVNKIFKNEIIKDKEIINQQVENVPQDIKQIVFNYFNYFPESVLLDMENFMTFEYLISFNDYYTNLIIEIDEYQKKYVINKIRKNEKYFNLMQQLKKDSYNKLVKIIGKYLTIDSTIHSSIVWSLVKKYAIEYFAKNWDKEYGKYFSKVSDKSIDELIYIYCKIDEINVKATNTVGIFTYYLMYNNKFINCDNHDFLKCNAALIKYILKECEKIELEQFKNKLINTNRQKIIYSIDDVDLMTGIEFENFINKLFMKMGYSVELTKASGDQGIDVIAEKDGEKIGIQAKCYSSSVSNSSVQEVVAGKNFYKCDRAIVITNNYFTKSAIELAKANNVILWNREMLKVKIEEVFNC